MPLKPTEILDLLRSKRDDFSRFDKTALSELQQYGAALGKTAKTTATAVQAALTGKPDCGALPLEPWDQAQNWVIPCGLSWPSREASLEWVRNQLTGISTFAVDGSQIFPGKDLSIPVALVQIGWFENFHLPQGGYEKDIAVDVMTPQDLRTGLGIGDMADRKVNLRRFEMETQRLIQYMAERTGHDTCLAFFDGSLVATFADAFDQDTRSVYVRCVRQLLQASEKYRVPVVGYIDTSAARDLTEMLRQQWALPESRSIHDAQLLNRAKTAMQWGDRTPLFLCRRAGILDLYQDQADKIVFCYLKTNRDSYPVRLEMPLWVYEAGWSSRILDWVRGEVIIGSGYPYVIETADQVAVLKAEDRQTFFRLLQDWAEAEALTLRLARKMVSKARRR
jgi:NurA domain